MKDWRLRNPSITVGGASRLIRCCEWQSKRTPQRTKMLLNSDLGLGNKRLRKQHSFTTIYPLLPR